jgi:protein-disulfide isomerase
MPGKVIKENVLERLLPILLVATVILAFAVGILWQKVSDFEKGIEKPTVAGTETVPNEPQPPTAGKLTEEEAAKIPGVKEEDHIRGNQSAKVFLIEYSNFGCSWCSKFHTTAQRTVDEYEGQVAWVFRHFGISPAATASECAAELGGEDAFWNFAHEVFSEQSTSLENLPGVAAKIGLDQGDFESCIDSGKYEGKLEEQHEGGLAAGVTGTPANFIVNDKGEVWFIPGAVPFETLKQTIDEALQD